MAKKKKVAEEPIEKPTEGDSSPSEVETYSVEPPASPLPTKEDEFKQWQHDRLMYAMLEIQRCDDYIQAHADSDRLFTVYRSELYDYRYRLRQLQFDKNYPDLDKMKVPSFPVVVRDR